MSNKHFDIVNFPRHETLRLMAGYLQGVIEQTDKMPESRNELTRFHAKSIPTIDIMAYLNRILKYAPCENDCFLSVLVYFNRMATLQNSPPSFVSSCKKRRKPIIINSYNIHRLLIIGIMIAAKFYSDIFFTNSHYAKVGGLPVLELNQLEIEFLLINDFDLHISVEEIQETGDLLLNHKLKYPLKINANPTNDVKMLKHTSKLNQSSQQKQQQKEVPVPPRVTLNEAEETGRRHSRQQSQPITSNRTSNAHLQYNIQFTNSVGPQAKRSSSYDEYNRDMIDSAAATIDSFDNEPIQKFATLNTATINNHRSPIPNVYTLQRTTSKTASAKLRNSLIMSMNSNIPLSSTNNINNNSTVSQHTSNYNVPTVNDNSMMSNQNTSYRYSYQSQASMSQPQQHQSQQPSQSSQQILQQSHYQMYQTPQAMPQQHPPQAVLMDSQYNAYMYEQQQQQQQQQQQNEMMKKYNEVYRMSQNQPSKSQMTENSQYMMYKPNNNMSYSTGDLYNQKRASNNNFANSNLMVNPNNGNPTMNGVYQHPLKSKSSSSLNTNNDWHNKELPPIKIQNKQNSSSNINNPHSANDILYQQISNQSKPLPQAYTNSPIKVNTINNRLSVNNSLNNSGQFDSPLDAPPRLTKFFGYMPSEVISPIKIADDYQQDLQKMEDMTSNFYLTPLNSQSTHSPNITQSFSNLHINSNNSSNANTPLRSYNNSAASTPNGQGINVNIPSGHLSNIMDPSTAISPLAAKASNLSLSPTITTNNRPYSLNIDPTVLNHHQSLNSPISAKSLNKHFSVQPVERLERGISSLSNLTSTQSINNSNLKRYSSQPSQPPLPESHQTIPSLPRSNISSH